MGWWLDCLILVVFSNMNDCMIIWFYEGRIFRCGSRLSTAGLTGVNWSFKMRLPRGWSLLWFQLWAWLKICRKEVCTDLLVEAWAWSPHRCTGVIKHGSKPNQSCSTLKALLHLVWLSAGAFRGVNTYERSVWFRFWRQRRWEEGAKTQKVPGATWSGGVGKKPGRINTERLYMWKISENRVEVCCRRGVRNRMRARERRQKPATLTGLMLSRTWGR